MSRPEDKTILIVDDEPDVVAYFSGILERAGFKVLRAADGQQALGLLRAQKPDFISLDLVMPEKSGIKFLYELRRNRDWSRIPVMIVTAHARDDLGKSDFDEIFAGKTLAGPLTYLEKPVRPEQYLDTVKRILGLSPIETGGVDAQPSDRLRAEIASRLKDMDLETLRRLAEVIEPDSPQE